MEENVFGSLDEIDAALDETYGKTTDEPEEVVEETPVETETNEEPEKVEGEDLENTEEETKELPQKDVEGEKENKKDHAFADLRVENGNLKKERDGYKADSDYLKELAASYGYTDVQKFQDAVREIQYQKEAKANGYDPALYKKTMEQERRIAQLEKERDQEIQERKLERFQNAVDNASKTYNIDIQDIIGRLENSGISVEALLNLDNPKILLDGLLIDEIKNNAKQSQIENLQNLNNLAEGKNEQGGAVQPVTIESLLKDDLAKYKKDNYFD